MSLDKVHRAFDETRPPIRWHWAESWSHCVGLSGGENHVDDKPQSSPDVSQDESPSAAN
jgi:hypothetical protein